MYATHIRVITQDEDGTRHVAELQLSTANESFDVVSIETISKGVG